MAIEIGLKECGETAFTKPSQIYIIREFQSEGIPPEHTTHLSVNNRLVRFIYKGIEPDAEKHSAQLMNMVCGDQLRHLYRKLMGLW